MMNLTELKKMLQKDFNVKYLSDLEQIELVQNNEDLHIGVVKVELKVSYKNYVIGTFGVLNKNAKVDGRKVKASMTYLNKIATWFIEKHEVDVKIFKDSDLQEIKKVKMVELLTTQEPTQAIEKVACEVEPTIKEETQEQPTTKESCKTVEPIATTKKVNKMKKVVDYVKRCQFDITNMPQNTEGLEHLEFYLSEKNRVIVEKLGVYEVFLFNGKEMNRIICKNQEEVIKVVRKFAFSIEMPFNPTEEKTTKESCQIVEPQTIKEETQEQPTFEEKREYKKTHMELIYNIVTNNVKGFNEEYKNRAITRHYKFSENYYGARYKLSYFYHDEKEKWMFTLKNHDGILLNYNIHKSLLDEKWLLNLCKQVNDIINETK